MAAKMIALVCVQFALFNTLNAQVLNRIVPNCGPNILPNCGPNILPNCGPNILPLPVTETIIPNQLVLGPNYPQVIDYANTVPTTIIQDSTVANNLANALQLLVVSNLLSNTLNAPSELLMPGLGYAPVEYNVAPISPIVAPVGPCGFGPYSYVY